MATSDREAGKPARRTRGRRRRDAHYRELERLTRELLAYADKHPLHHFAAGTQKFLAGARPVVEQMDSLGNGEAG